VVTLKSRLPVLNLLEVGGATLFESISSIYKEYNGRYILKASDISFIKAGKTWESSARIFLNRTNRTETITEGASKTIASATENFGSAPIKVDSVSDAQANLENKIEESKNTIQQAQAQASQVQDNAAQAASGNFELTGPIKEGGLTQSPEEMANIKQIAGDSKELSQDSQKTLSQPPAPDISEARDLNSSGENALENYMNKANKSNADLTEGEQKTLTRASKTCPPIRQVRSITFPKKCNTETGQWEDDFD
jgi:chromosome segregation ATPase